MESIRKFMGRSRSRASSSSAPIRESQHLPDDDIFEPLTDEGVPETPGSSHDIHDSSVAGSSMRHDGLPLAYVAYDSLRPSDTSRTYYPIFQKKMHPTGYSWKHVPTSLKEEYFTEFKKLYSWPVEQEAIIKKYWMKLAKSRYSDLVSKVIKKNAHRRPAFIKEADWPGWLAYWEDPAVQGKAATNSRNRMSEVAGPGTGPAKHAGGSKSTVSYIEAKMRESGGVQPPLWEINRAYHMQSNGQWVSEEFRQIDETVIPLLEAAGGATALSTADADRIYMEAVGGIKKQRIRGAGSYGSSLASDYRSTAPRRSTSYCSTSIDELVSQRVEARTQADRAQMEEWKQAESARMQAQMQEQMSQMQTQMQTQMQEQLTAQMQAQMAEMMKTFMQSRDHSQQP